MTPHNLTIHATDSAHILAVASAAEAALAEYTAIADHTAGDNTTWPDWWHEGWRVIDLCQQALELAARRGRGAVPTAQSPRDLRPPDPMSPETGTYARQAR
jgi:hypothetical protein